MSKKQLTRRAFLRLSTMAGAGTVLAASGVAGAPTAALTAAPAAAAAAADLRFVWWGGQLRSDVTTQVIKLFETTHPNVAFTFEPLGVEAYRTTMTTPAAGGGRADVVQHGAPTWVEWTKNSFRQPLDASGTSGVIDISNVPDVLQTLGMIDGKLYGVSTGPNATGFVVDRAAFAQAGIAVPAARWTGADFGNVVKELHTKLGIWGFGMFLDQVDRGRVLSVMSLGDCTCIACRTKRKQLESARGPTRLALLST